LAAFWVRDEQDLPCPSGSVAIVGVRHRSGRSGQFKSKDYARRRLGMFGRVRGGHPLI
jgi:hypothetical protein